MPEIASAANKTEAMDDILRLDLNTQLDYSLTLHSKCDETISGLFMSALGMQQGQDQVLRSRRTMSRPLLCLPSITKKKQRRRRDKHLFGPDRIVVVVSFAVVLV